ncbi:MAG TPA: flavin reductase family protein [Anaerolineae bacterium]|jgi:flavin reductase (DIM6/NTAB) family NADH-FMN oxidoreductase RutF
MTIPEEKTIDTTNFRRTMGLFATGVTVVLAETEGDVFGMTANAVTSVSLEPPLVLVCVEKKAHLMTYLRKSGSFSINILNEDQADLSRYFASMWTGPEPPVFSFEPWVGGPRLVNTLASIACEITEYLEGGDHWIVLGRVIDLYRADDPPEPLLFYRGQYRQVQAKA